jgi:hypothetical protein
MDIEVNIRKYLQCLVENNAEQFECLLIKGKKEDSKRGIGEALNYLKEKVNLGDLVERIEPFVHKLTLSVEESEEIRLTILQAILVKLSLKEHC